MKLNLASLRWSKPKQLGAGGLALLVATSASIYLWPAERQLPLNRQATQVKFDLAVTQPLPEHIELDANKVALGNRLFHDARLSSNNTVSCSSCHNLANGGTDNLYRSVGVNGGLSTVNAPTVFNSGFNFVQFWDGRAASLEDQVEGPVNNPKEMASNWKQIIEKLTQDQNYPKQYNALYNDGITVANTKDAIATFERSLVTPNSRFDKFLRGDHTAINNQEKHGYALFQSYSCTSCHQGINLGGNMYERMGLVGNYFTDRGHITEADNGRFNVNHQPQSLHEFRVPSLRNVALTAPYFHDGHAQTLEQAISIMTKYQLGTEASNADVDAIAAFLRTLTGEYQGKPL